MNLNVLAQEMPGIVIALILVGGFGLIVLLVILLKKKVKIFKSDETPKSDKEIAAEELDRILEPVEELSPVKEDEDEPEEETKPGEEAKPEEKDSQKPM